VRLALKKRFPMPRVIGIRHEMAGAFLIWIKICARLPLSEGENANIDFESRLTHVDPVLNLNQLR